MTGSYGINGWVYNPPGGVTTTWGMNLTAKNYSTPYTARANEVPMFLDCVLTGSYARDSDAPPDFPERFYYFNDSLMARYCMDRHGNGRLNCLFLDGSVRTVGCKELWTLKWSRDFDTKNGYTLAGGSTMPWPEWMRGFKNF